MDQFQKTHKLIMEKLDTIHSEVKKIAEIYSELNKKSRINTDDIKHRIATKS